VAQYVFQGGSALTLDGKGRVTVPARHRDVLAAVADSRLTVTKHPNRCLLIFPRPAWEEFRDKLLNLPMAAEGWRRIFIGSVLTMFIASFVTFWIPLFNGLLGGAFGGYHAGRMKRALAAAAVNSVAVPGALAFLYFFSQHDAARFFYGLGFQGFVVLHVIGTFIGAVAGAASRPLVTGDLPLRREPLSVSASPTPAPGGVPTSRPASSTETETTPPSGPGRGE
jgi:hypothetical protein